MKTPSLSEIGLKTLADVGNNTAAFVIILSCADPDLMYPRVSSGILVGSSAVHLGLKLLKTLPRIRRNFRERQYFKSTSDVGEAIGRATATVGFCLSAGFEPTCMSRWLVSGGLLTKSAATFLNDPNSNRMISPKFFLVDVMVNLGAIALAVGSTIENEVCLMTGGYILGISLFTFATWENFSKNFKDLKKALLLLQESTS